MVSFLMETDFSTLKTSVQIIPQKLYDFISIDLFNGLEFTEIKSGLNSHSSSNWMMFDHGCTISGAISEVLGNTCPESENFCCQIYDPCTNSVVMITNYAVL